MAGFSKIYCIGGPGGYLGSDGINPISMQILVGDADRMWLEPRYFDKSFKPIGKINTLIPKGPDDPNMLIDSCISFASNLFLKCDNLKIVTELLKDCTRIDFDQNENVPKEWDSLRKEAYLFFKDIIIYEANLKEVNIK